MSIAPEGAVDDEWEEPDLDTAWITLRFVFPHLWDTFADDLGGIERVAGDPELMARFNAECFASLRHALDFREKLPGLGLTLPQAVAIIDGAVEAETRASGVLSGPVMRYPVSEEMRRAIMNFWIRGLPERCIDYVLSLPQGTAGRTARQHPLHPGAKRVMALFVEGLPPAEISRRSGVAESSVWRILTSLGENPGGRREDRHRRSATIRKLRDRGMSHRQIAERLDVSVDTVKSTLRWHRRRSG